MTRNADASSALLWCGGNLGNFIFVLGLSRVPSQCELIAYTYRFRRLVQDALRAPETDNPPNNMRRALIFGAVFISTYR